MNLHRLYSKICGTLLCSPNLSDLKPLIVTPPDGGLRIAMVGRSVGNWRWYRVTDNDHALWFLEDTNDNPHLGYWVDANRLKYLPKGWRIQ